jgi:hypothetical protein
MFEYKSVPSVGPMDDLAMNRFGADGWELVGFAGQSISFCYVFKRSKETRNERDSKQSTVAGGNNRYAKRAGSR